jgi:hypothetical protein
MKVYLPISVQRGFLLSKWKGVMYEIMDSRDAVNGIST